MTRIALSLFFSTLPLISVSAAQPVESPADATAHVQTLRHDEAVSAPNRLHTTPRGAYIPYTTGQEIPDGWQLVTMFVPVTETRMRTICEEREVMVPKQVRRMVTKKIRIPTEIYKTYVKFREVEVESCTKPNCSKPLPGSAEVEPEDDLIYDSEIVRIPQFYTKVECFDLTKYVKVPATKTVLCPCTKVFEKEVPYEVCRMVKKKVLIPCADTPPPQPIQKP